MVFEVVPGPAGVLATVAAVASFNFKKVLFWFKMDLIENDLEMNLEDDRSLYRCNVPYPSLYEIQYSSLNSSIYSSPDLQTFQLLSSMHAEGCNAQAVEASFSDAQLSLRVEDRNASNVTAFLGCRTGCLHFL